MAIIKEITLDLNKRSQFAHIILQQGDSTLRQIDVIITNNGDTYTFESGASVILEAMRPDNVPIINSCAVVNNKARITITSDLTAVATTDYKRLLCKLQIINTNGTIHTPEFHMIIKESVIPDSMYVNTGEFTALTDAFSRLTDLESIISEFAIWETYDNTKQYLVGNKVILNGSSYYCIYPTVGNSPTHNTDNTWWKCISAKGDLGFVSVTQVEYDALTKDANTYYLVG